MNKLFQVKNLKKSFLIKKGIFRRTQGEFKAVDGVSFTIHEKEVLGLVGESGSGKSTTGRAAIRLIEPSSGEIFFQGIDFCALKGKALKQARQKIQMVFQDPLASLNPRKTILENVGEALIYHKIDPNPEKRVKKILDRVGIPASALAQYPHQFSGGQQQRISIGRALALRPKLIICDEAVSALDLSVQAQVLNLLHELRLEYKLSYLFISHDLSVVKNFCDRILVMHKGKIVEEGDTSQIFAKPQEAYTQKLLSSVPIKHPRERKKRAKHLAHPNLGSEA